METESGRIILNTLERNDLDGDTTASPVYISQDLDVSKQRLKFNGQVQIPLGSGYGKIFTSDSTGIGSWQDAPNYYVNVLAKQQLYVDAGVKDTLKFNADSSGLVKDVMRSSDSVYIKINGVWEFAFIDSVGQVS